MTESSEQQSSEQLDPQDLAPLPQEARLTDHLWQLPPAGSSLALTHSPIPGIEAALDRLSIELERLGVMVSRQGELHTLLIFHHSSELGPEAYRLRVEPDGAHIDYGTSTGAFRAITTLCQWVRLHTVPVLSQGEKTEIHGIEIRDWPDFPNRGLLLDISRNRVPTLGELEGLVDQLAELKFNQLQLYTEHTFAYEGHETVWRGWSPLTAEEITQLAKYARERHIEWVPNQNSFGHLHRWLVHEPYRRLAESPDGIEHPFSLAREPFSLCPTDPASLELLEDLYGQLLPLAESSLFNANLDETLDLGLGRSEALCTQRGKEEVYLDFVYAVHRLAKTHGKRMMIWGDIILKRPDLIARLPEDVIVLEWGYEADHPFAEDCARFAASGRELYVCPGTGGWSTFSGRTENTLANLSSAAIHGRRHGASGYLLTDWGDHGHLQPPIIGWPGWVAGACFSWNVATAENPADLCWARMLDTHVLRDTTGVAGQALLDLGRVQDAIGVQSLNGSPLFYALMRAHLPAQERRGVGMTQGGIDRAMEALASVLQRLSSATIDRPDAKLIHHELDWVAQALRFAAHLAQARLDIGEDQPLSAIQLDARQSLMQELDELTETLRPIWLARSRPGGLEASIARLTAIRPLLEA